MNTPEQFRLFIALRVPDAVKDRIEAAQAELRHAAPAGAVRWTTREQFHLTLKFLGNVESQRLEALASAAGKACRSFAALQLQAARIGFFPDARYPRVVWAGVRDQQENLPRLQSAVEAAAAEFSAEAPEKRFSGHVTLGRIKMLKRPEAQKLAALASTMTDRRFGEWTAREVEIIRSELSPQGARYTAVARLPLLA